jgi:hypothetical protein
VVGIFRTVEVSDIFCWPKLHYQCLMCLDTFISMNSIPGIGQLQPTRMPQGSCSAGFSFTELMYIVLSVVPPSASFPGMESALVSDSPTSLPKCASYVDDIFSGCRTFDEGYSVLADELLP